jgi:hypothetical protein
MAFNFRLVSTAGWSLYILDSALLLLLKINAGLYYLPLIFWGAGIAYMFTQFSRVDPKARLGLMTAGTALRLGYGLLIAGVLFVFLAVFAIRLFQSGLLIANLLIDVVSGVTAFFGTLLLVMVVWRHRSERANTAPGSI